MFWAVDEISQVHVWQLLGQADRVEGVARWTENGTELRRTVLEALHRILAVVENHAAEGVVDAVVHVVAELPAADGLADDLGNGSGGGRHEEPSGLRENLDWMRKQAVQLLD